MQENLWGEPEEIIPIQRKARKTELTASIHIHLDGICNLQGHSWEYFGITGLKVCSVCTVKGYCPGCTPTAPVQDAQPFFCTKHTPLHKENGV